MESICDSECTRGGAREARGLNACTRSPSVHDHYRVLLDAVSSSSSSGSGEPLSLDYDKRRRAPPLETSAKTALSEFEYTQQRIRELFGEESGSAGNSTNRSLDKDVKLSATTPSEVEVGSTLGREVGRRGLCNLLLSLDNTDPLLLLLPVDVVCVPSCHPPFRSGTSNPCARAGTEDRRRVWCGTFHPAIPGVEQGHTSKAVEQSASLAVRWCKSPDLLVLHHIITIHSCFQSNRSEATPLRVEQRPGGGGTCEESLIGTAPQSRSQLRRDMLGSNNSHPFIPSPLHLPIIHPSRQYLPTRHLPRQRHLHPPVDWTGSSHRSSSRCCNRLAWSMPRPRLLQMMSATPPPLLGFLLPSTILKD